MTHLYRALVAIGLTATPALAFSNAEEAAWIAKMQAYCAEHPEEPGMSMDHPISCQDGKLVAWIVGVE